MMEMMKMDKTLQAFSFDAPINIEAAEDGESRFLSRQDELVIGINYDTVDPWGGEATLTHLERGYVLDIRTVEYISQ